MSSLETHQILGWCFALTLHGSRGNMRIMHYRVGVFCSGPAPPWVMMPCPSTSASGLELSRQV
jgi:hypothetical protein